MRHHATRSRRLAAVIATTISLAVADPAAAVGDDRDSIPRYRPPQSNNQTPSRLLGGQSRGTSDESLAVAVIAPDHTGLTTRSQPTLYWYTSQPLDNRRVELTIEDELSEKPMVELNLRIDRKTGLIPVRLSELGIRLEPNREYKWSIAVVEHGQQRSRDVVTSGYIRRVARSSDGIGNNAIANDAGAVFRLAENGLWYDAFEALDQQIERAPEQAHLRRQRAALLEQVGLSILADRERRHEKP